MSSAGPANPAAAAFLALPLGTRVVVRYRIDSGATDALGFLLHRSALDCQIRTARGDVTILLAKIIAAKQVPPAPSRPVRSAR